MIPEYKIIFFSCTKPELFYIKARQSMHTHKMTQCNNIQSTVNHRTVFRQQFTQQFYECSVMWNVNRFQREMPGLSAAPSPKCPRCSGRCLYLATCITLRKLCGIDTFWLFTIHTHSHSFLLTVQMKKARCHYISTTELKPVMVKSDMSRVLLKKFISCLCIPLSLSSTPFITDC